MVLMTCFVRECDQSLAVCCVIRHVAAGKSGMLKEPTRSTEHTQVLQGRMTESKRKSIARSHLNHFNQVLQMPTSLLGPNLWHKQGCVIAVWNPWGPVVPFSSSFYLFSEKQPQGHILDPFCIFCSLKLTNTINRGKSSLHYGNVCGQSASVCVCVCAVSLAFSRRATQQQDLINLGECLLFGIF